MHESSSEDRQTAPLHLNRNHVFLSVVDRGQLFIDWFTFHDFHAAIERVFVAAWDSPKATVSNCRVLERNPEPKESVRLAKHVTGILMCGNFSSNFGRL